MNKKDVKIWIKKYELEQKLQELQDMLRSFEEKFDVSITNINIEISEVRSVKLTIEILRRIKKNY